MKAVELNLLLVQRRYYTHDPRANLPVRVVVGPQKM